MERRIENRNARDESIFNENYLPQTQVYTVPWSCWNLRSLATPWPPLWAYRRPSTWSDDTSPPNWKRSFCQQGTQSTVIQRRHWTTLINRLMTSLLSSPTRPRCLRDADRHPRLNVPRLEGASSERHGNLTSRFAQGRPKSRIASDLLSPRFVRREATDIRAP